MSSENHQLSLSQTNLIARKQGGWYHWLAYPHTLHKSIRFFVKKICLIIECSFIAVWPTSTPYTYILYFELTKYMALPPLTVPAQCTHTSNLFFTEHFLRIGAQFVSPGFTVSVGGSTSGKVGKVV